MHIMITFSSNLFLWHETSCREFLGKFISFLQEVIFENFIWVIFDETSSIITFTNIDSWFISEYYLLPIVTCHDISSLVCFNLIFFCFCVRTVFCLLFPLSKSYFIQSFSNSSFPNSNSWFDPSILLYIFYFQGKLHWMFYHDSFTFFVVYPCLFSCFNQLV